MRQPWDWVCGVRKMAIFPDVQSYLWDYKGKWVGGSEKVGKVPFFGKLPIEAEAIPGIG